MKIEEGYNRHGNPYHNACHGADVAQTIHYILHGSGLKVCPVTGCVSCTECVCDVQCLMNRLEILSVLLAALIHDVDHPGTTNNFQINQQYVCVYYAIQPDHTCMPLCVLCDDN